MSEFIITPDTMTHIREPLRCWSEASGVISHPTEIVRCRDCKHFKSRDGERPNLCGLWLPRNLKTPFLNGDGFCAWGEPKVVER